LVSNEKHLSSNRGKGAFFGIRRPAHAIDLAARLNTGVFKPITILSLGLDRQIQARINRK